MSGIGGRGRSAGLAVLTLALVLGLAACGANASATDTTTKTSTTGPLRSPKTTPLQDTHFLADAAKADSDLETYVQQQGNTALKAMLTDGTAFCAFLHQGVGLDQALVDTAAGARSLEATTHLPLSVKTFNTLEAVALITLCPSEQRLVPATVRTKIHALAKALNA